MWLLARHNSLVVCWRRLMLSARGRSRTVTCDVAPAVFRSPFDRHDVNARIDVRVYDDERCDTNECLMCGEWLRFRPGVWGCSVHAAATSPNGRKLRRLQQRLLQLQLRARLVRRQVCWVRLPMVLPRLSSLTSSVGYFGHHQH